MQLAFAVTATILLAEVVGGILTNSLALLADAGHMASDIGALGLSLGALWLASRPPSQHRTYGFHRAEVLAALLNSLVLMAVAGTTTSGSGGSSLGVVAGGYPKSSQAVTVPSRATSNAIIRAGFINFLFRSASFILSPLESLVIIPVKFSIPYRIMK